MSLLPTVVVVHRLPWLSERLQLALTAREIDVVGYAEDGATGSGMSIALAPSLLLLEAWSDPDLVEGRHLVASSW